MIGCSTSFAVELLFGNSFWLVELLCTSDYNRNDKREDIIRPTIIESKIKVISTI